MSLYTYGIDTPPEARRYLSRYAVRLVQGFEAVSYVVSVRRVLPDGRHAYLHRYRVAWVPADAGEGAAERAAIQGMLSAGGLDWGAVR